MAQTLAQITFVVREYDEAIAFFTGKLGFHLVEDTVLGDGKRWVVVKPDGPGGIRIRLLLAQASTPEQFRSVGNQTGGRVFLFLHTRRLLARLPRHAVTRCEVSRIASRRTLRDRRRL